MTALVGVTGVADANIFRSRKEALAKAEAPAVIVEWFGPDQAAPESPVGYTQWQMPVSIGVYVRGNIPDQLADPIIQSLHSKVMADQSLGGFAQTIEPISVVPQMEEGDQTAGFFSCQYRVTYRTAINDLTRSI